MNEGLKAHQHIRLFSAMKFFFFRKSGCLPLLKNNGKACERGKSGRERAEPSYPKRTKGSFRCMVSIDRNTHPHFFIRRAGCHAGVGFPRRCQLLLHTVGVSLAGGNPILPLEKGNGKVTEVKHNINHLKFARDAGLKVSK